MSRLRPHRRIRARGGFTLIEVVIASAILAVGLLAVAAMQIQALRQSAKGRDLSSAASIARDQLEVVQRMPWANVAPTAWAAPPWINVAGFPAGTVPILVDAQSAGVPRTQQSYAVEWRVQNVAGQPDLRAVDVRVTWQEPDRPNHTYTLSTLRWNDR